MLKSTPLLLTICFILLFSAPSQANSTSPVGLWKTIDDASNKPRSLVRISENNGELIATIEKGLLPDDSPNDLCDKCEGARKNKPIIGMVMMDGMRAKGDAYEGGHILDPDNGKVYNCKIKLDSTGKQLEVRGFIGISLIGRSQIWVREE
jgi:uncharacterized protein (DUF2147 family)